MKSKMNELLTASSRLHTEKIVEYILRGNGRRLVPNDIYLAAWEIHYALNRMTNKGDERHGIS